MARTVITVLVDDIDGTDADETIAFGLDGQGYEIDLSTENVARLRESVSQFVEAARRDRSARAPRRASVSGQPEQRAIREWAQANGIEVNDRGRIRKDIVEQYRAAQG
jgi:hypothetical protein